MLRLTEVASQSVTFVRRDFIHPSSFEFTRPLLLNGLDSIVTRQDLLDFHGKQSVDANETIALSGEQREYGIGAQILLDLGVRSIRLLSNNPRKLAGVTGDGLFVSERIPIEIPASESTRRYLKTKKEKLGHELTSV